MLPFVAVPPFRWSGRGVGGSRSKPIGLRGYEANASSAVQSEAPTLRWAKSRDRYRTKKEPKPKLLSPDIFRWGRGLPHEGAGAKKFGMALETREIKLFWRDIPGFGRDIGGGA